VPPAPLLSSLKSLWELPVPEFLSPQPLPFVQPDRVAVDPVSSPAMHKPASNFFRSLLSIAYLLKKCDINLRFSPWEKKPKHFVTA